MRSTLSRAVFEHGRRLVPEPAAISAFSEPCLAFEWLWGALLSGLISLFGPSALTGLTMLLAASAVLAVAALVRQRGLHHSPAGMVLLTSVGAVAIGSRVKARPQVLFMLLLPGLLWWVGRYLGAPSSEEDAAAPEGQRRRRAYGVTLGLLTVLWAQLHGSFILIPGIFGAMVLQDYLDHGLHRARVREDALVLLGVLVALLTSAAGFDLISYIASHGGGDAVNHIREMSPLDFATLSPFGESHHFAVFFIWALGLCGLSRDGRPRIGEALLAILGVVLISRAGRFIAAATILALPLAIIGVENLARLLDRGLRRRLGPVTLAGALIMALLMLGSRAETQALTRGPLGHAGWTAGAHPVAALAVLDPEAGSREVLTDYRAGPALAYWSSGRIRHYVDGRTPQYFDDTDYGVQRELMRSEAALLRGIERYGVSAAVVRRKRGVCRGLDPHWSLVAVDPMYSTFMPTGALEGRAALSGVAACGERYLATDACQRPEVTRRSLDVAARSSEPAFVDFLRAVYALDCLGEAEPLLSLPDGPETWGFRVALRRQRARAAVRAQRPAMARRLVEAGLDEGDAAIVQMLPPGFENLVGAQAGQLALERAIEIMDDDAPPSLRARLALLCAARDDIECARFHGLRAAARGEPSVAPVLELLAARHPRAQVRADASRWLEVLMRSGGDTP